MTMDASIIVLDKFIQATRDSGYKGTYSAVSELVDNSLQAGARKIRVKMFAGEGAEYPVQVAVLDDGCGMDRDTLRQALRFGGSTRFNDREGLGRFGMGLPNSSLSQARRVEVYTWQRGEKAVYSYLDVDNIVAGEMTEVPRARVCEMPKVFASGRGRSGTLVVWSKCDRLSHRRMSTMTGKLALALGRIFRHYIWEGCEIFINGQVVAPVDPTFQRGQNGDGCAAVFGEPISYEIACPSGNGEAERIGRVTVTFTELPVHLWHNLPNEEKRRRGIADRAGVSIIRARREVDYGWFFMGGKRRENYDDWWRCEIQFDPVLDDAFGITHTKQQIRPQEFLNAILVPDIENMAKILNNRVRQSHIRLKSESIAEDAERRASEKEHLLTPLPKKATAEDNESILTRVEKEYPQLKEIGRADANAGVQYSIRQAKMKDTAFFCFAVKDGHFLLVINPEHPFYRRVYGPLEQDNSDRGKEMRCQLELMLLAAARAEAQAVKGADRKVLKKFREEWSNTLATFLSK